MIKITHDMLGAYEVIAAGILGSHFHPDLGEKTKDLIVSHWGYHETITNYFNTSDYLKILTYDYRSGNLEANMMKLDLITKITDPNDEFKKGCYVFEYEDGTVFHDWDNMLVPIAIIAD